MLPKTPATFGVRLGSGGASAAGNGLAWDAEWVNKIDRKLTTRGFGGGGSTMENRRNTKGRIHRTSLVVACVLAAMVTSNLARAQQVVLVVNGDVITTYDIEQRMKFVQLSTRKPAVRNEVIENLIDDKLKVQIGRRYKIEIPDGEIDAQYADMGHRMHMTPEQLTQALAQGGVDAITLKSKIRSDTVWQNIVRGKFQGDLQVREKDVLAALQQTEKKDEKEQVGYEYRLRPILFLVPRKEPQIAEARHKDAEALRGRFTDCDSGLKYARTLRDVAVRDVIVKSSSDLAPALREILDKTEIGHLTAPEMTPQGVELFALCERKETTEDTPEKRQAREKIFQEKFQLKAKRFLLDLRKQAMIERK
jgi:peptidyl-prolyl cis-trans isomerase SurA